MSRVAGIARSLVAGLGLEVTRTSSSFHASFLAAVRRHCIDGVLDVGANDGEFARLLRTVGFRGKIHSFEPLPSAFARLREFARADPDWHPYEIALGDSDGTSCLHESENSVSSSLLRPLDVEAHAAEGVKVVRRIDVATRRLDSLAASGELAVDWGRALLKIDVQGSEDRVLAGCGRLADRMPLVLVEVSFQPLYEESAGWIDLVQRLERLGFSVIDLQRGFRDARNSRLLQADVLLERIP